MTNEDMTSLTCFLSIPYRADTASLHTAIDKVLTAARVTVRSASQLQFDTAPQAGGLVREAISASDLVIAEVSEHDPQTYYQVGLAHALGKPVVFLLREGVDASAMPVRVTHATHLTYGTSPSSLRTFRRRLAKLVQEFREYPGKYLTDFPTASRPVYQAYTIDLEQLDEAEFENLCFELLSQMGFRQPEWGRGLRGMVDAIATLPKKDPDGHEYQEVWLVSMGRSAPPELMVEALALDPDRFIERVVRTDSKLASLLRRRTGAWDTALTLLLILRGDSRRQRYDTILRELDQRLSSRPAHNQLRLRWWTDEDLERLIRERPQIAFKYFSEEGRFRSKYRKTPEELYAENVRLTEELLQVKSQLESEKERRFIAERDAAWKDVAFKAAHKLGNPVDALDTYLLSLRRRIEQNRGQQALDIAAQMEVSIEEAKCVVAQFKSLSKADHMNPRPIDMLPLIQQACKVAEEKGVRVDISAEEGGPQALADPDRISECLNELVANSVDSLDKPTKHITVRLNTAGAAEVPLDLPRKDRYARIRFEDNGMGVLPGDKDKIFAPFYTTRPHGTGLGLSLVQRIIEGHGGAILENGTHGQGACFEIYLPIAESG